MKTPMHEQRYTNGSVSFALQFLFALLFLTVLTGQASAANCTASYTYTSSGGSSNYTLNSGQSLKLASGTYTGTIEFRSGSSICVETGATFTPGNLNNAAGTLTNYGTANLQTFSYNSGTVIDNYGTLRFTAGLNTNGATTFHNRANATMTMANGFQLGNNSTFTNDGLVSAAQDFSTQQGTTLTNNYRLEAKGNFNPDGIFTNNGRVYAEKFINMNSNLNVTNNCLLVSFDGFNSNNPNVINNGTILITKPGSKWQHNAPGTFYNGANAKVAGQDFINNSSVTGSGAFIFSGSTTNQGAFNGDSASNKINFYDETQTGNKFFDNQNTTPTNTVRTAFVRPTELDSPDTCTSSYKNFATSATPALSCPSANQTLSNIPGYALTATKSGTVENSDKATGGLENLYTTASSANAALVRVNGQLTLDLGHIIPANATLTVSLTPATSNSRVRIETSLNGSGFMSLGTFGSSGTLGTYDLDKLTRLSFSVPAGGIRYVRFVSEAARSWVDGVEYSHSCQVGSYDFGDAPASYGNPSHTIIPNLSIGQDVDADNGTQQNANADADDTNGSPDDEDGLQNPAIIPTTAGQNYTLTTYVKNETGSTAYLTAYIDFNRDGDFSDLGERADTQHVYWNGYFQSTFTVPAGTTAGTTYVRLRLSQTKAEAEAPIGAATSGEVEDHKLTISAGPFYDFGDAPASYGNPRHTIVNSIFLGTNRPDSESSSQHTYNASGDGVDEDGSPKQYGNSNITLFPILKMTATSYSVDIKATNTSGSAGKLYGWIDLDQNGTFDADEAASANVTNNTNGTVTLTWNNIPTDIKLGTTFIRLRLTTDAAVTTSTPANNANDGEVEDFPIAVAIDVPPDSPDVTIVRGEDQTCSSTIFTDNFDDLASEQYFGANTSATPFVIRNWTATGGGSDTYARTVEVSPFAATQGRSIYFGNGMMRRYYPSTGGVLGFDGNGRMLEPPDAVELRDDIDDVSPGVNTHESDWGPEPVTLSRTFASTAGQRYRLYFSAIPEGGDWSSGIMRVDTPSGSVHFKAPGLNEGIQKYRIEFTAIGTSSTIRFVNYGHIGTDGGWCDPNSVVSGPWCTVGGFPTDKKGNELIIDDVAVALATACPSSGISGAVYSDTNGNNAFDGATETGLANISVSLYDNNGTTATTSDDNLMATTSTAANGAYSFASISPTLRYRVEVDSRDADLPASAVIGTINPLADLTVSAGSTLANQNFGFDLACNASAGQFGGIAFRDYNQNGMREPQEEGIAGITVTAYNSANAVAATATTDARGWYTLSGLTNGTQYRLEYTNLPSGLYPGAAGTDTASTVRFVTASGNCAANFGISDPIEYCQAVPPVAAFNFVNGNPGIAGIGNYASLFTFPYDATGAAYSQNPEPVTKANTSQTGALWGMAYQKTTKTLYTSATMRRFSGFGALGSGGIYKVDMTDPNAADTGASAYIDLRSIGIDTGNDVRTPTGCDSLATGAWSPSNDVAAWDKVGKVGVGDIDYDEPNNRLWLINLNDRKLYGIANVSPTTTPTATNVLGGYAVNLPSPYTCTSGIFRPWAVKYHRGYVYVGGVCDAANDPYNLSKVRGYVLRLNPANTAAGFSHVKDFAINQPRSGYGYSNTSEWSGWLPQADAINVRPQFHSPIVGNLEFDTDGSIIVGIIDRAGLQKGTNSYDEPACDDPTIDYVDTMGDVLRLCKTESGDYLNDSEPGCSTTIPANSKTTDEYYWGDLGPTANAWEGMNEIAAGGLALAPGKEHVLASAYDANSWGSNGVVWLNNRTGAKDSSYHVSWSTLGKSTGMGELEVLCDPSPVEVGNRVWLDTDKDGIQDAGEAGISNVNVTLTCGADSASTTTNTNGEYYFSNAPGKNATFMGSGESCSLSIANAQASLSGYNLTTQNADSKTDNNSQTDIRDSDAAVSGSNAVINFTVGSSGQNNHGLDFGYKSTSSPGTVSGTVYLDANKNATFDAGETGIANITVSLYNENGTAGDLSDDTLVNTATTNASGAYSFTNVDASRTYRAVADTTDPDLPANTHSTTTNPLTAITVTAGGTTANKNFGFGQVAAACSPPSPTTTGINASITWNHNPFTPASQTTGGHPVPAIFNTGLIASAANEVRSNLTTGATDWEMYAETASVPATLAEAISSNKYFGYSFTTQASLSNSHILYGVALSTLGPNNIWNHSGKYKVHIRIDDNAGFASPIVAKNLIQIDEDNPTTGGDVSEGPLYGSDFYISHYDFDTPANLEANKTYYLRFYVYDDAKAGVANSTPGRIIFDDLLLKTLDCGAAPSTLLSVSDAVVTEGNSGLSYLNFPVHLSAAAPAGGVSFNYATADGTATLANNDYQSKTGTLTIPMGANGSVISVPVVGDTTIEPNEKISLNITNVVNAQYINGTYPEPPQGSIINDDAAVACNASSGHFGGIVFQDYNQNGTRESGEIGLAGIIVTAYNSSNAAAATATTDAGGWYKLTGLTNGTQYRLEFTGLPSGTELGAAGSASATNIQFVTVSATCNANLGVYNPVDYCQADPKLLTARYINGDTSVSTAGMAGTFGALLSYPYSASGIAATLNQDALASQVGSVWGLAYNRHTKRAFASAMVRRHVGLGPLGIGGLYVINYSGASPVVSNFLNLDGLAGIDVGSIGSNSARSLPGDPYLPNHDPTAFDKTGKEGLGDVELSDDGNTLYVTNLYSRKIIKVDLTAYNTSGTVPTTATEISLPTVSCTNGVARPFALKYYRGKLHAGITCTGENGGSSADLKASIQAYDGTSWTEKLQVPLNYQTWHADHMRASEYSRSNIPWVSSMSALTFGDHGSLDWADDSQLLLSGIEFDSNGDMLLGFIDRTGLQFGQYNYGTDTGSTRFYGVFSNGELLKAGYNASTGAYTLENAGSVNGIAGAGAKIGTDPAWPYGGPGGGEFYGGEKFAGHTENSFGALAVIPGKQEVALNAMNPFNLTSGGTIWLDNNTGSRTRGIQLYGEDNRFLGKAVGLGDIEVLCDPAPTEIGNRVWLDSDSDGLQGAGEAGINNVTVTLTCGTDTATATTNAQGEYYFSNKAGGNATFMGNGESCNLSINNTQASLSTHTLTTQNAGGRSDNDRFADIRDSDAAVSGSNAVINFTVGSSGQNNHGLDFGYKSNAVSGTITGTVYTDSNTNDTFDAGAESGIGSITVTLLNAANNATVATTSTVADGTYNFSVVDPALTYNIQVDTADTDLPAGSTIGTTNPLTNRTVTAGATLANQNFGFDSAWMCTNRVNTKNLLHFTWNNGNNPSDQSTGSDTVTGTAWTDGTVITSIFATPSTSDFSSGAAQVLRKQGHHSHQWGFNSSLAVGGVQDYNIDEVCFDYKILGHSAEGMMDLKIGGKSFSIPLPSTQTGSNNTYFDTIPSNGIVAQGSVLLDFVNNQLSVSHAGFSTYTAPLNQTLNLAAGTSALSMLTKRIGGGATSFDVNVNSTAGADAFYTIDNFVVNGAITPYTNNYCVTPSGTTGLLELGNMSTSNISGSGSFAYANRVLPGFGTVDVSVVMTGGVHSASTSAIDNGARQQSWLDENLPVSGTAIYLGPNSSGTATVTYNFAQPTGNVDLLLLDVDEDDTLTIAAKDGNGNNISDFSGWRYRSGDLSVWANPSPVAPAPHWNSLTATLSSSVNANDHRSFGLLTPDTLVTQIVVTYTVPAVSGRHIYTTLHTTTEGRDGDITCPATTGTITGTVYTDSNTNDVFDAGTESGIGSITVTLLNAANNATVATTSTAADGTYNFSAVDPALTYNIQVDTADTDLPAGATIGTANPLTNRTVTAGSTLANQNFGFDVPSSSACDGRSYGIYFNAANNYSAIYEMTDVGTTNGSLSTALLKNNAFPFKSISLTKGLDNKLYSVHSNALTSGQTAPLYVYNPSTPTVQATNTGISLPYPGKNLWWISGGLDPSGNLYFMLKDGSYLVKINLATSQVTTVWSTWPTTTTKAPGGENFGQLSVNVPSSYTLFYDITFDSNGDALITDADGHYVWKVTNVNSSPTAAYLGSLNGMNSISDPQWINDGGTIRLFGSDANTPDGTHYIDTTTWNTTKIGTTSFYDMASCDFSVLTPPTISNNISGKVFEDKNYGGGVGRPLSTSGTAGILGVRVELYNSTGAFVTSTTTADGGPYSFSNVATGNYYVRVVNDTIRSTRAGSDASERGIQTFRSDGTIATTNEVGGRNPAVVDAAANTTNQTINTSTFVLSGGGQAQSVQPITMASSDITGANFGFNFSTVVNTNDSGQGSLRQGILNANLLANTGMTQPDSNYGVDTTLSKEVLVFNIPASGDPQGRADICGGTTCNITVNSQLPDITAPLIIDGTTQPGYAAGTPGIPRIRISPVTGLDALGISIAYNAPDSTVRGLSITGFRTHNMNRAINAAAARTVIESNYIGVKPDGTADANGQGIMLEYADSATSIIGGTTPAKRNIISGNLRWGIAYNTGATAGTIQNNFIGTNVAGTAALGNQAGGIDLESANDSVVLDNVIAGNASDGIQIGFTNGSILTSGYTIRGNRIGVGINGEAIGNTGPGIMNYGGSSNHQIGGTAAGQANIIANNTGGGIKLAANTANISNVISGNSIYANGGLGIDLGNNGVTVNDANDADTGANNLLNFPILSQISINSGNMSVKGCAPTGATVELFEADVSVGGKATPGDNKFGKSKDYGEGQTYLASFVEGSASDTDSANCTLPTDADGNNQTGMKAFSVTIPAPPGFVIGDTMTATATVATVGTSEFSPVISLTVTLPPMGCSVLDNFDSTSVETINLTTAVPGPITQTWNANIDALIGGSRTLTFGPAQRGTATNGYGVLEIANNSSTAAPMKLCYNANGAGLNVNLSQIENILFNVWEDEHHNPNAATRANIPMTITLSDGFNSASLTQDMVNLVYQQLGVTVGWANIRFPLANFSNINNLNRTNVQSVCIEVAGKNGHDYSFQKVMLEDTATCKSVSGKVFEDVNYGGGVGRAISASGTKGTLSTLLELYDHNGRFIENTATDSTGSYTFPTLLPGNYYTRVVSSSVNSTRSGTNGTELGITTYRTDGVTPTVNQVGGRNPSTPDADTHDMEATLNTSTFQFIGGALNGKQAQVVQPITLAATNLSDVSFGFNFDTVTNTNDSGAGSLRQFLINANLLGGDATLAQVGRTAGKENAILELSTGDPNYTTGYWSIPLQSALPGITAPIVLDASLPPGSNSNPILELKGTNAGSGANGLTLGAGSNASTIRKLAITGFAGSGIYIDSSNHNSLLANHIGITPSGITRANTGSGIRINAASSNKIGGINDGEGNLITNNGGSGISITGSGSMFNSILGNSIYANTGLGIDLVGGTENSFGVTANDEDDVDSGPNSLINYPDVKVNSFGANGTKIVTHDFHLDLAAGDYRLEFFVSTAKDASGNGEGQTFIGSKDLSHPGTGNLNFKGTLNAKIAVAKGAYISATLTQKTGPTTYGSTSEFSGIRDGITTQVCESLIDDTTSGSNMVIDETDLTTVIKLLEAKDSNGNPITYVISGGADGNFFTITNPAPGATLDCATIKFLVSNIIITKSALADNEAETRAIVTPGVLPLPGNYELPMDKDKDNVYDLQITATTVDGKKYVRDMNVRVMDTNEAPNITSTTALTLTEDSNAEVLSVKAQDPDANEKLSYRISGGVDSSHFEINATTGLLRFRAIPDYDAPMDTNRDNLYEVEVTVTDKGGLTNSKLFKISIVNNTADDGVVVNVRALLQGAYDSNTALMSADLNTLGLLPNKQPYQYAPFNHKGTETLSTMLKEITGNNAVVDWALVDLRTSVNTIVASRAVMLQRDGDLVDSQTGSANLHFANIKAGNYYISVRHRNHLGVMTASPVSLDNNAKLINFAASSTAVKGEETRALNGKAALMWAGDINGSNTLTANGPGNDVTSLLSGVITSMDNLQGNTNHILSGYLTTDLNFDGKTLFTGPSNDTSLLVGNILLHPLNTGFAANYIVRGGLQ